ncbi:hypothetical protein ABZV93_01000 [Actinopolymorpha sp. NPDC004070]|uniref:EamA family transporter n=1 Tax=Actinopolymorpha sp. NPDC004070 TaxID=3154548 RepID=UPI00339EC26D
MIAAATTVVLWASAFVAIRHVGAELSPGALSLGRLLVGSVVLGVVMLTRSSPGPRGRCGRGWWCAACCGSASTTSR